MNRILSLLPQLPGHSLVSGGSHRGQLYAGYTTPPLNQLPAFHHETAERLQFILGLLGDIRGKRILDAGCANGALTLALAEQGAIVEGWDVEPVQIQIAKFASEISGIPAKFNVVQLGWNSPSRWAVEDLDIIIFLSVFKWIWRNDCRDSVLWTLGRLAQGCRIMLFESGICDSGLDLIPLKRAEIPRILTEETDFPYIQHGGYLPDNDPTVFREVWKCWR